MTLSLYWVADPPCYVVAESSGDVFSVMDETWGPDPDRTESADPSFVPAKTPVALLEEFDSATPFPLGPAVAYGTLVEVHTAEEWAKKNGRGILIEYEP